MSTVPLLVKLICSRWVRLSVQSFDIRAFGIQINSAAASGMCQQKTQVSMVPLPRGMNNQLCPRYHQTMAGKILWLYRGSLGWFLKLLNNRDVFVYVEVCVAGKNIEFPWKALFKTHSERLWPWLQRHNFVLFNVYGHTQVQSQFNQFKWTYCPVVRNKEKNKENYSLFKRDFSQTVCCVFNCREKLFETFPGGKKNIESAPFIPRKTSLLCGKL